jgi:hypothetical protein
VPDKKGTVVPKPFSACSVEEMRRAIQRKRKPASSKPVPAEDVAQAAQYQKAVNSHMPTGVNVKLKVRNEKGKSVLDITSLPMEDVETLIEALMSQLPSKGKERKEVK